MTHGPSLQDSRNMSRSVIPTYISIAYACLGIQRAVTSVIYAIKVSCMMQAATGKRVSCFSCFSSPPFFLKGQLEVGLVGGEQSLSFQLKLPTSRCYLCTADRFSKKSNENNLQGATDLARSGEYIGTEYIAQFQSLVCRRKLPERLDNKYSTLGKLCT